VVWKRVSLVGIGLLGGSLGLALKQRRLAGSVVGYVRRAASIRECENTGAVDRATRDLHEAIEGADLIILCTPLAQMRPLVEQMVPSLRRGVLLTDVGSVKGRVVGELEPLVAKTGAVFVGSHPMAGSEKTGVAAASADLFEKALCVVTPTRKSPRTAILHVEQLWESVGARPMQMTPELHDAIVSRSSHLPFLLAAALANFTLNPEHPKDQALLCAGGFRDTTRIASGSPEMWRDIALANRKHLSQALASLLSDLRGLQKLLKAGDAEGLHAFFAQAKHRRDQWVSKIKTPKS
jgi:prephenate dehydrogenase